MTPAETLSRTISERLGKADLIVVDKNTEKFISGLASGKMKIEDWKLLLEKGLDRMNSPVDGGVHA